MSRYVALLRGINVGGKNLIPMIKLKACMDRTALLDVTTYIQSGNVLFKRRQLARRDELRTRQIEKLLTAAFEVFLLERRGADSKATEEKHVESAPRWLWRPARPNIGTTSSFSKNH